MERTRNHPDARRTAEGTLQVLVVDDNPGDLRLIRERLRDAETPIRTTAASGLEQALERLRRRRPDLVLLDLGLPESRGLDTFFAVKENAAGVPIVVLTGLDDEGAALEAVRRGAQDYLVKGEVDSPALVRSVRYAVERHRIEERLAYLASHDALTGLFNRRALFEELESRSLPVERRRAGGLSLLLLDLDHFKTVNDRFGHAAGDELLRQAAEAFRAATRPGDVLARIGGDEFVVALPGVSPRAALRVAERIVEDVGQRAIVAGDRLLCTTVSVGVARYPEDGETADELLAAADAALYEAKERGRSRLAISTGARAEQAAAAVEPAAVVH